MASFLVSIFVLAFAPSVFGWGCPGDWVGYGDDDPHFVVNFTDSNIDRPVCFDLDGEAGESYTLFSIEDSFRFDANLIPAAHKHDGKDGTYFGSFTFTAHGFDAQIHIDTKYVTVTEDGITKSVPWPHSRPYSNKIYPQQFRRTLRIKDFVLTHMMHDYLHLNFGNTSIHIDRHNRKYCEGEGEAHHCPRIHFLGVYLHPIEPTRYEGILGEHIGEHVEFRNETLTPLRILAPFGKVDLDDLKPVPFIIHRNQKLRVTEHKVLDRMKNEYHSCWKVIDNARFMHHSLEYYRVKV